MLSRPVGPLDAVGVRRVPPGQVQTIQVGRVTVLVPPAGFVVGRTRPPGSRVVILVNGAEVLREMPHCQRVTFRQRENKKPPHLLCMRITDRFFQYALPRLWNQLPTRGVARIWRWGQYSEQLLGNGSPPAGSRGRAPGGWFGGHTGRATCCQSKSCQRRHNCIHKVTHTHTHTHPFNGPLSRTTRYQKGKTNLVFTEARDSEWHWHQLGHLQVCTSLQTDNHASTLPHGYLSGALT